MKKGISLVGDVFKEYNKKAFHYVIDNGLPSYAEIEYIEKLGAKDFFDKYGSEKLVCVVLHRKNIFVGFYACELIRRNKPYDWIDFLEYDYKRSLCSFVINVLNVGESGDTIFRDGVVYVVRIKCYSNYLGGLD